MWVTWIGLAVLVGIGVCSVVGVGDSRKAVGKAVVGLDVGKAMCALAVGLKVGEIADASVVGLNDCEIVGVFVVGVADGHVLTAQKGPSNEVGVD